MVSIILAIVSFFLTTICTQEFSFLGVTGSNIAVFWIIEDVGGECYHSELVQITVDEKSASEYRLSFAKYKQTDLFKKAFNELQVEPQLDLAAGQDSLYNSQEGWSVVSPPKNDSLMARFHALDIQAEQWNSNHGEGGTISPTFRNCSASLLSSYDRGLYVNYKIKRAHFIPSHRLLIVFTDQPSRGPGLDMMDGFMIFKITK